MTTLNRFCSAAAALCLATVLLPSGAAVAQSFDLSGVETVPALAERVPQKIRERGVLIIGSDNAYAPWEYLAGADGQTPEGIDVDLSKAIAITLGLDYESRTAPFASILPSLGAKYDVGISAFSITKERMEAVNFITYADTQSLWVVRAGNPTGFDPADYCGRTVAIQSGSYHEKHVDLDSAACVEAGKPAIEKLPFSVQTEAITRVAAGGAEATATGGATAGYAAVQSKGALETMTPEGPMGTRGLNGITVAKADMELTTLLADAMNHLIETGVYQAIYDHWGIGRFAVDKAVINPDVDQ